MLLILCSHFLKSTLCAENKFRNSKHFMWSNIILTSAQINFFNKSVGQSCEGNKTYKCLCFISPKVKITHIAYVFVICIIWYSDSSTLSSHIFDSIEEKFGMTLGWSLQVQLLDSEFYSSNSLWNQHISLELCCGLQVIKQTKP